ncbi:TetR/AcrR family transcriptional regulator [Acetobacteraceae bacterium H6797]|nr:TetR/AcrR family transcriptional regulator [Acetobacteraceae bacterium H6797]
MTADSAPFSATMPAGSAEGQDNRERLLNAAEAVFLENGFQVATMDAIAKAAGCSKKTIYKAFASKEELFFGVLSRGKKAILSLKISDTLPPEEALADFVCRAARYILAPHHIAVERMVLGEYTRNPALMRMAQAEWSQITEFALEIYLRDLGESGQYEFGPPREASHLLMGMAIGAFHHEIQAGMREEIPDEEVSARARRSVEIFLAGTRRA